MNNPSCTDLIVTKIPDSLQNMSASCTLLSGFHKLIVLRTYFRKWDIYHLIIGDYDECNVDDFKSELKEKFFFNSLLKSSTLHSS